MKLNIPNPCSESWENMDLRNLGRFCRSCEKTVIDFTNMSPEGVKNTLEKHSGQKICGRFRENQLNRTFTLKEQIAKTIQVLGITSILFVGSISELKAQDVSKHTNVDSVLITYEEEDDFIFGDVYLHDDSTNYVNELELIEPMPFLLVDVKPEFPYHIDSLQTFFDTEIELPHIISSTVKGKVFLECTIFKDGQVGNFRIVRGLHTTIDKEVLRVAATMPKWKPAKHNGTSVDCKYIIPIVIDK